MQSSSIPSEINGLPLNLAIGKKRSKVVDKLHSKKKELHENRSLQLKNDMEQIKIEIDEKIRGVSVKVRDCILNTKKAVEEIISKFNFDYNKCTTQERGHVVLFNNVKNNIVNNYCARMKVEIDKHEVELKSIENERMAALKTILKNARDDQELIGYKLPHDLQVYYENEIIQLNQMTLNNYYTYKELNTQLMNIALSSEREWIKRLDELHCVYERRYTEDWKEKEEEITEDDWGTLTLENVKQFTDRITMEIFKIESEFQTALAILYNVLDRISQGKYDEVQQLDVGVSDLPRYNYISIYNEVFESLFEGNENKDVIGIYTVDMMVRWQEVVDELANEVEITKSATQKGLRIWDFHFHRQLEATDVFLNDLWDVINKSNDTDEAQLIELHKAIDILRMNPNEDSLKGAMGDCKKIIDLITKTIEKNYDKQMKYFDKYREMMIQEYEILYLEMAYFVKCMPVGDDVNPTIFRGRRSRTKFVPPEEKPMLMKEFDAEIKALHNWVYGVNQELKKKSSLCHDNALKHAENWINANFVIVYRYYSIKMSLVADMYQQIFHHVYRVRLAELITHQKRFDEHLLGIDRDFKRLRPIQDSTSSKNNIYTTNIFELTKKSKRILSKLNKSKDTHTINSLTQQLKAFKTEHAKEMKKIRTQLDETNAQKINELLCINVEFVKQIRFFGEDGNYSFGELAYIKKSMTTFNKNMLIEIANINKHNDEELEHALKEIDSIEETIINESNGKNHNLGFKEFLKNHLGCVRSMLKDETQLLADNSSLLSAHVEHLKLLADRNLGNIHYLDDFTSNCEYMQKILQELYLRIHQKEPFDLSESFFKASKSKDELTHTDQADVIIENIQTKLDNQTEDSKPVSVSVVNTVKSVTQEIDTFRIVFPRAPDGDDYMAKIIQILFESLETLQIHAQDYYKNILESKSENALNTYESRLKSFMITYLAKYIYYQLQCDEILLEVTINYILELDDLLSYMTEYYKQSLKQFVQDKLNQLSNNCSQYKAKVNCKTERIENAYRNIIEQLKPLYGHPKNKNLLDNLSSQMNSLEDKAVSEQVKMDAIYSSYEAQIEQNLSSFEAQLDTMDTRLKKCLEHLIMLYIEDEHIFDQLRKKLAYFERIIDRDETMISDDPPSMNIEIINKLNSKLQLLKHGLKISSSEFSSFLQSKWTKASTVNEKYSSSNLNTYTSVTSLEFYTIMENFKHDQQHCLHDLAGSKGILQLCEFWSKVWQKNVAEINALYLVKYVPSVSNEEQKVQKKTKQK